MDCYHTTTLHPFNGLFSGTTWVSQYQEGKTSVDLNEARDDGGFEVAVTSAGPYANSLHTSRQITTPSPHHSISTGRMLFFMPNQQYQSTEGRITAWISFDNLSAYPPDSGHCSFVDPVSK